MSGSLFGRLRAWLFGTAPGRMPDEQELVRLCHRDPAAARDMLVREQRRLSQALTRFSGHYDARLQAIAAQLRTLDAGEPSAEALLQIAAAQKSLARLFSRLALAERDTPSLKMEWQDWERFLEETQRPLEPVQAERLQILRAELIARGISVEARQAPAVTTTVAAVLTVFESEEATPVTRPELPPEDLAEWDEQMRADAAAVASAVRSAPRFQSEAALCEHYREERERQGALRLHDRRQGIRRDRLALVEWI